MVEPTKLIDPHTIEGSSIPYLKSWQVVSSAFLKVFPVTKDDLSCEEIFATEANSLVVFGLAILARPSSRKSSSAGFPQNNMALFDFRRARVRSGLMMNLLTPSSRPDLPFAFL